MAHSFLNETNSNSFGSSNSDGLRHQAATPVIVSDPAALRKLIKSHAFHSKEPIIVRLPDLSLEESEALTSRINGYRNECGCSLGAKSMVTGFSVMLLLLLASYSLFTSSFWLRLPFAFVFAFVCAGAGKAVGLFLARRRFRIELDQLYPSSHSSKGDSTCLARGHH